MTWRERCSRAAICMTDPIGHRLMSVLISSSVQRGMEALDHGGTTAVTTLARKCRHSGELIYPFDRLSIRPAAEDCSAIVRRPDQAFKPFHPAGPLPYAPVMALPSGFIKPCLPSKVSRPPTGPLWVHEIEHDGYRLMVRRDGSRVRCFTRGGHDWANRFPAIVDAALRLKATSFLIDGEAVIARDDGTPDFHALRNRRRGREVVLFAFDLIGHDGDDLCGLPLIERKRRLKKLIGRSKQRAIQFNEHLKGDGQAVFDHVCQMGLEGIVSKRVDAPYRSGPSKVWLTSKNPAIAAVRREHEESVAKFT